MKHICKEYFIINNIFFFIYTHTYICMYVFWIKINKGGRIHLRITHQLMQILKDRPKCLKKKYLWTKVVRGENSLMSLVQAHRTCEWEMCYLWYRNYSNYQLYTLPVTWQLRNRNNFGKLLTRVNVYKISTWLFRRMRMLISCKEKKKKTMLTFHYEG